ncbi:MAG: cytidine deaminase [Rikenellaceae bacterium]
MDNEKLISAAAKAAKELSYSPYSQIRVGAAAMLESGEIVTGANVENSSYPVGVCAEQSLLCTLNNLFNGIKINSFAVVAFKKGEIFEISPCGKCRQALLEKELEQQSAIEILFYYKGKIIATKSASELLPYAFSL